jgi:hypothetical protein
MKLNLKEIATAWYNVIKHTPEQKELADKRFAIGLECPSRKEILEGKEWSLKCSECGCPLKAKVYTKTTYLNNPGSCPLNKWKEIETEYLNTHTDAVKYKFKKTVI